MYRIVKNKRPQTILNIVKKALTKLGALSADDEMTTVERRTGRTWQEIILSGEDCEINDGWYIIEICNTDVNEKRIYVDLTGFAVAQLNNK